jgi:hypothetical protein
MKKMIIFYVRKLSERYDDTNDLCKIEKNFSALHNEKLSSEKKKKRKSVSILSKAKEKKKIA